MVVGFLFTSTFRNNNKTKEYLVNRRDLEIFDSQEGGKVWIVISTRRSSIFRRLLLSIRRRVVCWEGFFCLSWRISWIMSSILFLSALEIFLKRDFISSL